MSIRFRRPERVAMTLAPGVEVSGIWNPGSSGDRDTPAVGGWVDVGTLEITGRPDLVTEWLFLESGVDPSEWHDRPMAKGDFMERLAQALRIEHEHEDSDHD